MWGVYGSDKLRGVHGDAAWERLGHMVGARRQEILGSRRAAAEASGVGDQTWVDLEGGIARRYYDNTKRRMMRALRWTYESWEAILAGGDPVEVDTPTPEPPDSTRLAALEVSLDEMAHRLADLQAALEAVLARLPPGPDQ